MTESLQPPSVSYNKEDMTHRPLIPNKSILQHRGNKKNRSMRARRLFVFQNLKTLLDGDPIK